MDTLSVYNMMCCPGKLIVVHVPLHRGLCEHDYVIDMDRHATACSRPQYVTESRVVWRRVRDARVVTDTTSQVESLQVCLLLVVR